LSPIRWNHLAVALDRDAFGHQVIFSIAARSLNIVMS
jgi:hypothetical protein